MLWEHRNVQQRESVMKYYALVCCVALSSVASIGMPIGANAAPIGCSAVAGTVSGKPGVKSVTSALQPASGSNVAYCKVSILYGNSASENINIVVGLPLNTTDGGTGGVQGAWNGRTQGLGGGGCSGTLNPLPAVNTGYVGSGTDGGHDGAPADTSCANGLNPDGTFNVTWIDDFFHEGIKQQVLFSKAVAASYYGMKPAYNYWNGCSTGGRQGYQLAQELGHELEGILANAPAMNWQRFATAQIWGEIAIKDLVGAQDVLNPAITNGQFAYATNAAIAACDGKDGVVDGIIDEPRTCDFSANTPSLICTANGGASADPNCLTPQKARAIDLIWDGPRHANGNRIWYPQQRGTALQGLSGNPPFGLTPPLLRWNENSTTFDWHTVTLYGASGTQSYAQLAMDGSTAPFDGPSFSVADEVDTDGNLDIFKDHGGKLLTFVGGADQLIQPGGVIHYYRQMAALYGINSNVPGIPNVPNFTNVQGFYRLFRAPGVAHCGGGVGPQPQNLFGALVNWVENGVAPDTILASGGAVPTRTRPLCPYPTTAIYNGSGNTDDAANFHCGGNLETFSTVCNDVVVKYKHENSSAQLDFTDTGVNRNICGLAGKSASAGR